jgi:hypothetical protein
MHCEKIAVTNMLFRQCVVTEVLMKDNTKHGMASRHIVQKEAKNITLGQHSCGNWFLGY